MESYFSVINVSLGWPSGALAPEPRVTKPLEHSLTRATEPMESEEEGKKKGDDGDKSRGEEEETVGVRRKKDRLKKITSILE